MFLDGYGDNALALKFFERFRQGQRRFLGVRTSSDLQALREFATLARKLEDKYYSLPREIKERLDWGDGIWNEYFRHNAAKLAAKRRDQAQALPDLSDSKLYRYGVGPDPDDTPDEEVMLISGDLHFNDIISSVTEIAEVSAHELSSYSIEKRVDWGCCATTLLAKDVWFRRTGNVPPRTAHADTPGPFGLFLEDILKELFVIYDRPPETAPSARSALRALNNVTNSGVDIL